MPLPIGLPQGKTLYSIAEQNEGSDEDAASDDRTGDDILALIRSKAKPSPSTTAESRPSKPNGITRNSSKAREGDSQSSGRRAASGPNQNSIAGDELKKLNQEIQQIKTCIVDIQRRQEQDDETLGERHDAIVRRISSSCEEVSALRQEIKDVRSSVEAAGSHSRDLLKSFEGLNLSVSDGQQGLDVMSASLKAIAEELESRNIDQRESLLSLKLSAEIERKSLQAQIENERAMSTDKKAAFEKEIGMLRKEREDLEEERHQNAIEKERLAGERRRLEQSEALFEQRRAAARETIENADARTAAILGAEARLAAEMERLVQLSEYVRRKDDEARRRAEEAAALSGRLREMDASVRADAEDAERRRREVAEDRMRLARERVRLLKERAGDGEGRGEGAWSRFVDQMT